MRFAAILFVGLYGLVLFLVKDHVFFWDTIQLGSKHAHWYFEDDFRHFLLPAEIDSGHPPFFGMYLAFLWKIFGKSLWVGHFAMFPFLAGIVIMVFRIGDRLAEKRYTPFLMLLVAVDPVFAGQSILISPDVVLAFFFLLGTWGVLSGKSLPKIIGAIGLGMISTRGMMVALSLFLFEVIKEIWIHRKDRRQNAMILQIFKTALRKAVYYLPGGLIASCFLVYHYYQTGWIGYHADSVWAPSFEKADFRGFLWNVAVVGWRFLDFGRVFLWVGIGILGYHTWKKYKTELKKPTKDINDLLILFLTLTVVVIPPLLIHQYITAHRYLLPLFLCADLLFFYLAFHQFENRRIHTAIYILVAAGLATGNLWIYPRHISQGWDSTLAHWPHYELREKMIGYIQEQGIPFDSIGTAFPEIGPFKYKDLTGNENGFVEKNLSRNNYVLYSNVMNDFTDEEIRELDGAAWTPVREFRKNGVFFVLYRKSNSYF
jgi:hypothetical protein